MTGVFEKNPAAREVLPFSLLKGGVSCGTLTEVCGVDGRGKTEFVLRFLAENRKARVAWIEEELTIYPCAFAQYGVALDRVLFVEAEKEAFWTAQQVLRSRLFKIVVLSARQNEAIELRRLQLAAEQSSTALILLSQKPTTQGAWPIGLQVEVHRPQLRILKNRGIK